MSFVFQLLEECRVQNSYNIIQSIQRLNSLTEDYAIYYIKQVMRDPHMQQLRNYIRVMDNVWVCDRIDHLLEISWRIGLFYIGE